MAVFAIGDLHLPGHDTKPMDIFGSHWENHFQRICENWRRMITPEDIVLLPGDTSWAMQIMDVVDDLNAVDALPGKKLLLRGNHDYWWSSLTKLAQVLPPGFQVIQNNAISMGGYIFAGSRGWIFPTAQTPLGEQDEKIFRRELIRLEMSLQAAVKLRKAEEPIIVMTHYPPLFADGLDTDWTRLLESYPVEQVVYGHLHGAGIRVGFNGEHGGIQYRLVSCDALDFCPARLDGEGISAPDTLLPE